MMTKESEKGLKVTRNAVETTSAGSEVRLRPNSTPQKPNNKNNKEQKQQEAQGQIQGDRLSATGPNEALSSQNGHTETPVNGIRPTKPCCLCWCCCCSCSWYRNFCLALRGNNENKPKSKDGDSDLNCDADIPPSLEEVRSWGDSFDKLMRNSGGRKVFREFLKLEFSEENILFWLAVEDLKKETKPELIEEKARLIYEDYISILSPKEVSLDSRVREVVNQNMVDPSPHTFDEAQMQIFTLMHRDSYPRFVNSLMYKKLAQLNLQHRGSSVSSAVSNPASRKESLAT